MCKPLTCVFTRSFGSIRRSQVNGGLSLVEGVACCLMPLRDRRDQQAPAYVR
jgi:hypothetical protein